MKKKNKKKKIQKKKKQRKKKKQQQKKNHSTRKFLLTQLSKTKNHRTTKNNHCYSVSYVSRLTTKIHTQEEKEDILCVRTV